VSLPTFTTNTLHKCSVCNNIYKTSSGLKRHMIVHSKKEYQCHHCSDLFLRRINLQEHLFLHFQLKMYKCPECEQFFMKYDAFYRHMAKHSPRFQCHHCSANYLGKHKLLQHLGKHFIFLTKFICSTCTQRFATENALKRHAICHSDIRNFKCQICPSAFKRLRHLNSHIQTHTQEKNHKCYICGRGFLEPTNLRVHMRMHSDIKQFKCHHCDANFRTKYNIERHMKQHFEKKKNNCRECYRFFPSSKELKSHLLLLHSGKNTKRYKCNQCPAVFHRTFGLNNHQSMHSQIQVEHKCLKCDKRYPNSVVLLAHEKTHGDPSFECGYCGRSFVLKAYLRRHLLIHTKKLIQSNSKYNDVKCKM
jgi:KRAB domain-containing zinc finger protein